MRSAAGASAGLALALALIVVPLVVLIGLEAAGVFGQDPDAMGRIHERLAAGQVPDAADLQGVEVLEVRATASDSAVATAVSAAIDPDLLARPEWRRAADLLANGQGELTVGGSLDLTLDLTGTLLLLAAVVLVLFGTVAVTTWAATGRALRPVEAVRAEVAAIAGGSLHRRVPRPPGGDEITRLADTMNGMLARLEEAARRQRRFVADASHELRSPLASARTQLEVALRASAGDAAVLRGVLEEHHRLERLTADLLRLARLEGGAAPGAAEVDLDELIAEEAARLGTQVDDRQVLAGRVAGDRQQLASVVRNLLDNAARHARQRVAVALWERDGRVHLVVDDDGPGVPPADRERVFERFLRLDEARDRARGGSGLGLAIVRAVVTAHDGTVRVEDAPAGGARLRVILPAAGR